MADQPTFTIELTKEQQLDLLIARTFFVNNLELPVGVLEDGEDDDLLP